MRQKRNRLKTYYHRQAISKKYDEGNSYIEYGTAESFTAEMWAAGGKIQAEMYGKRLPDICNLRITGDYSVEVSKDNKMCFKICNGPIITVDDGICLYASDSAEPDYHIVAIYPNRFLTLEVEKI